jgi:hypothetical protein
MACYGHEWSTTSFGGCGRFPAARPTRNMTGYRCSVGSQSSHTQEPPGPSSILAAGPEPGGQPSSGRPIVSSDGVGVPVSPAPARLSGAVLRKGIALLEEALEQMDVLEERVRQVDLRLSQMAARQDDSFAAAARAA